MRVKKIEPLVREALTNNPAARADDFILIYEVLKNFVTDKMPLDTVLTHHIELGVPSFASIVRIRRKLQELNPDLEPSNKVKEIREQEEENYIEYARSNS